MHLKFEVSFTQALTFGGLGEGVGPGACLEILQVIHMAFAQVVGRSGLRTCGADPILGRPCPPPHTHTFGKILDISRLRS